MQSIKNRIYFPFILLMALLNNISCSYAQLLSLKVSIVSKPYSSNTIIFHEKYDKGGNTSVAHDATDIFKWSGSSAYRTESWGYFNGESQEIPYIKRDRDLGQTFTYTGKVPKKLSAITVATGYGTNVVRPGTYQKNLSIQLFEVSGNAVLHNNGSDSTIEAFHGYPHNRPTDSIPHIKDDYFLGEIYTTIAVFSGAVFPGKEAFGFSGDHSEVPPDHPALKGRYLKFALPHNSSVILQPGKRYAFMIMIDQKGADCGFTLSNHHRGTYIGGHGIRRDGNGQFPPVACDPMKNFTDPANAKALTSAHFPADFKERTNISPGTNGYPDVDTWRDLEFYIEAK